MDSATTAPKPEERTPDEIPPAALLQLPSDWFNFLQEPTDDEASRRHFATFIERLFPEMEPKARGEAIEGLMAWRDQLWASGLLAHGMVVAPPSDEGGAVFWQIMVTLVKVPELSEDIDPGALLSRFFEQGIEGDAFVEQFETALGLGAGYVAQTPVPAEHRAPGSPMTHGGTAAAISCPRGGGWSILVMGASQDPTQCAQLGWLVGQIAGHSTLQEVGENAEGQVPAPQSAATAPPAAATATVASPTVFPPGAPPAAPPAAPWQ
ncbi:hypothetical protein ACTWP5_21800 [Streptomyces sp. 4N509B]|uniref:hypothetical protein n=1 Tax=Streptomyces sp. 4N509B TaxID=3457413 RepID=UPI003FD33536